MVGQSMRAIRVHQYGGPEELQLEDVPRPEPQAGEVLVRVIAAGVLPMEAKLRSGLFRAVFPLSFPYVPGSAMAGVVAAVGAGVAAFAPGQAVFGRSVQGTYAQYTVTAAEPPALAPGVFSLLARKPNALGFAKAATISGGATTAWMALFADGGLQPGQCVLIHGAAGGVGAYAVQFARWKGAHVIGTASAANLDFVRGLGADRVVDYTATAFEDVAQEVDLVLDTIGGETLRRSMYVVRRGGTLVSLLEQPPQDVAAARGILAMKNAATPASALLETIAALIVSGQVRATIARTFALHEVQQAHTQVQTGHGRGRIILNIDSEAD
jgi:NADPH:quinone reductase-like Zn-dependent oxidoreductase